MPRPHTPLFVADEDLMQVQGVFLHYGVLHVLHQALVDFNQILRFTETQAGYELVGVTNGRPNHSHARHGGEPTGMLTKTLMISAAERNFFSGFRKYWGKKQIVGNHTHVCGTSEEAVG